MVKFVTHVRFWIQMSSHLESNRSSRMPNPILEPPYRVLLSEDGCAGSLFVPESRSTRMSGSVGNTTGPSHRRKPAGAGLVSQILVSGTFTNNFAISGISG